MQDGGLENIWIMDSGYSRHMTVFEVRFKEGLSRVLDARGDLVCQLLPFGRVFCVDFLSSFGPSRCLMVGPSPDLWKWHKRLGHLSFDLLARLSSLGLIRGLPKLKAEKELVCHPCRHGKMVAASHTPIVTVQLVSVPPFSVPVPPFLVPDLHI